MSSLTQLAARLNALEKRVARLGRAPQLAFSAIEGGAIEEYDPNSGALGTRVGVQHDGTHGAFTTSGPVPPVPNPEFAVTPVAGGISVSWDGAFYDDPDDLSVEAFTPMDYQRIEFYAVPSTSGDVAPLPKYLRATIESSQGGEVLLPLNTGSYTVWACTRALSGKASPFVGGRYATVAGPALTPAALTPYLLTTQAMASFQSRNDADKYARIVVSSTPPDDTTLLWVDTSATPGPTGTTASYVATLEGLSEPGGQLVFTVPAGVSAGHTALLMLGTGHPDHAPITADGWATVLSATEHYSINLDVTLLKRQGGLAAGDVVTVDTSATARPVAWRVVWYATPGVDVVGPYYSREGTVAPTTVFPSIYTPAAETVLCLGWERSLPNDTVVDVPNTTVRGYRDTNGSDDVSLLVAEFVQVASGTTGDRVATYSDATGNGLGIQISLKNLS